ncbi:MAG: hypothetical protein ACPGSW_10530 [Phaeobacter italicus]
MAIPNDKETIGLFEPLMVSEDAPARAGLNDLALELAERSAAFRSSLPASIADALANLVRAMNCCKWPLYSPQNGPLKIPQLWR